MQQRTAGRASARAGAGIFLWFGVVGSAWAGPYSGPTDTAHAIDAAIPAGSADFLAWADAIDTSRTAFAPRGSTTISTTGFNSLGDLDAAQIAAGDSPGFLTVTFSTGVGNGPGADFAVFENGFVFPAVPNLFAELAYVEVSSNGIDFARFPSVSTNTTFVGTFGQAFAGFDATNIYNLAGKHAQGFGTPFDLDDLLGDASVVSGAVDLDNIAYVKLVDIPGDGSFLDSQGHGILDAWLTTGTGGFDFRLPAGQGVGVLHAAAGAGLRGDYNGSGQVEQGDLDLVLLHWGQSGETPPAGWSQDFPSGLIDQEELDGVLLHWGGTAETAVAGGGVLVPEPASVLLWVAGGVVCRRRRGGVG